MRDSTLNQKGIELNQKEIDFLEEIANSDNSKLEDIANFFTKR